MGVAIVCPVVSPKILNLICTIFGYKFVVQETDVDGSGIEGSTDASRQGYLFDGFFCLLFRILSVPSDSITFVYL
ncbi:hypothetical protein, partial [Undibacterium sp.]|uniref:hypothetical protein n=1 Tax=Undibacterium sp. TaxID=1914977 RepID=UPI0037502989